MHQTGQYNSPVSIMPDLVVDVAVKSNLYIKPSPKPSRLVACKQSVDARFHDSHLNHKSIHHHVVTSCYFSTPQTIPLPLQCSFHLNFRTLFFMARLLITCHHKIPLALNIQNPSWLVITNHNSQFTSFLGRHLNHHIPIDQHFHWVSSPSFIT